MKPPLPKSLNRISTNVYKKVTYMANEQESMAIKLVQEAENDADVYREALLEMSIENDQLYNDCCELYDKMVYISTRIDMVNGGLSSPEIALTEIGDIIGASDK